MAACNAKNSAVHQFKNQLNKLSLANCRDPRAWDWQASKNTLKDSFEYILRNNLFCDIQFIVGSNSETQQKIGAIKLVLVARSSVFLTMFSEEWSADCSEVVVPDVEPAAFSEMLRFVYSDEVSLTVETVTDIMYVAKKYAVVPLENKCTDFTSSMLCVENAFHILSWATAFDAHELVDTCLKLIADNTVEALKSDDFCEIDAETLGKFLKRSDLIISETLLFDAVLRWSKAACEAKNLPVNPENQRLVLKKVLPLLRFPLMTPEDFASKVVVLGILSEMEIVPVFMYFSTKSKKNDSIFSDIPRKACDMLPESTLESVPDLSNHVVRRFDRYEEGNFGGKRFHYKLMFSTNRDILLTGIGLYGACCHRKYVITTKVQNVQFDPHIIELSEKATWDFETSEPLIQIMFDEPVKVPCFNKILLHVTIAGKFSRNGLCGEKSIKVNLSDTEWVIFRFYNHENNRDDIVNYGQIPEIYFAVSSKDS